MSFTPVLFTKKQSGKDFYRCPKCGETERFEFNQETKSMLCKFCGKVAALTEFVIGEGVKII